MSTIIDLLLPLLFIIVSVFGLIIGISLYLKSEHQSITDAFKEVSKTSTPF